MDLIPGLCKYVQTDHHHEINHPSNNDKAFISHSFDSFLPTMVSLVSCRRINWRRHCLWWLAGFQLAETTESLRGGFEVICEFAEGKQPSSKKKNKNKNVQAVDVTLREFHWKWVTKHINSQVFFLSRQGCSAHLTQFSTFCLRLYIENNCASQNNTVHSGQTAIQ